METILNEKNQEVKELKLGQIREDVVESLKKATNEDEVANLTFIRDGQTVYMNLECYGQLRNFKGYENFSERLWVWACISLEDEVNIIATLDLWNNRCSVEYYDLYIQEIIHDYNEIEKARIEDLNLNDNLKTERNVLTIICDYDEGFKDVESIDVEKGLKPTEMLLGHSLDGRPIVIDLDVNTHLLLTGAVGTGKSTTIKEVINKLDHNIDSKDLELYFIQTKKENCYKFSSLKSCKECITPNDYDDELELMIKIEKTLKDLRDEVNDRSIIYGNMLNPEYKGPFIEDLPYIVIVIDEALSLFNYNYTDNDMRNLQEKCIEHIYAITRLSRNTKIISLITCLYLPKDLLANPFGELESVSDITPLITV